MLWMFGRELAIIMGAERFLFYYLTCVMGAGIIQLLIAGMQGLYYPTLGASGGVFGLLLACHLYTTPSPRYPCKTRMPTTA